MEITLDEQSYEIKNNDQFHVSPGDVIVIDPRPYLNKLKSDINTLRKLNYSQFNIDDITNDVEISPLKKQETQVSNDVKDEIVNFLKLLKDNGSLGKLKDIGDDVKKDIVDQIKKIIDYELNQGQQIPESNILFEALVELNNTHTNLSDGPVIDVIKSPSQYGIDSKKDKKFRLVKKYIKGKIDEFKSINDIANKAHGEIIGLVNNESNGKVNVTQMVRRNTNDKSSTFDTTNNKFDVPIKIIKKKISKDNAKKSSIFSKLFK